MNKKVFLFLLAALILVSAHLANAQQPKKVPRIGFLFGVGDPSNPPPFVEAFRQGLRDLGYVEGKNIVGEYRYVEGELKIQLLSLEIRGPNADLEGAFQAAAKGRASALITVRNLLLLRYPKRIADLAIKNRLPSMYEGSDFVEAGGLVSYASSDAESFKRAATYVDKILKGARPADLPVEQPTKFE